MEISEKWWNVQMASLRSQVWLRALKQYLCELRLDHILPQKFVQVKMSPLYVGGQQIIRKNVKHIDIYAALACTGN